MRSHFLTQDEFLMRRALALARRGSGFVHPNPMVGAVVVRKGKIVGYGWHLRAGEAHAEREAIARAGAAAGGATLYVSLEPCTHYGRTPPCVDAIIQAGISRVVVALRDPNPNVKGGGIELLRQAGLIVDEGVLKAPARELNLGWIRWISSGRPLVVVKLALSQDGRYSSPSAETSWISSERSRAQVQHIRRYANAVMVGYKTVLADNPRLTNRSGFGSQPLRIVIDSRLEVPPNARVYHPLGFDEDGPTPIALAVTTTKASYHARRQLELAGVEVLVFEDKKGRVDLDALLVVLGERGIQTVLCEGGGELALSLIRQRLCDRLVTYQAPLVLGGEGKVFFDELGNDGAKMLVKLWSRPVGPDVLSMYEVKG